MIELVEDIARRHEIRPQHIVGHSDIAPQRKLDPGPRFPWKRLADACLIPWPDAAAVAARLAGFEQSLPDVAWFQQRLARHDGEPNVETAALLEVLAAP